MGTIEATGNPAYFSEEKMAHPLPAVGTEARDALDLHHFVEMVTSKRFVTLAETRASVRKTFERDDSVSAVYTITLLANDDLVMLRWGPRGGRKTLWNFGSARQHYAAA